MVHDDPTAGPDDVGPTPEELAAIEAEWPRIAAELALLDAEIRTLTAVGGPSSLDWRRVRRAEQRVMREAAAVLATDTTGNAAGFTAPTRPAA